MTISFQEKHSRYRVYVSLGHRNSIQRTFHVTTYGGKRKALTAAKKEHARLIKLHRTNDPVDHPFMLPLKYREGTTRYSPMEIRNITITLSSNVKNEPYWSCTKKNQTFHTYPPNILVQFFDYKAGKRTSSTGTYKGFRIESGASFDLTYYKAIDHYIKLKPKYAEYRMEMLDRKPCWKTEVWPFILSKARSYYGDEFYRDCGGLG